MPTRSESLKRVKETVDNSPRSVRLSAADKAFIMNAIETNQDKLFNSINILIKESEVRVLAVIEEKINNMQTQIDTIVERVKLLETKSAEPENLKKEIKKLNQKLLKKDNSVVAASIRITGIPCTNDENLHNIFGNICNTINIAVPKIINIYRLNKIQNNNETRTPKNEVIVVNLETPYEKNFLLKSLSKYRKDNKLVLCQNHFGFESNKPVYINENLTPHNHRIFKEALHMKRNKKIKSAFTLRGLVYIKKFESDEPILIEFLEELMDTFRENNFR